jgi:PAS domain S-box-containing protein
MPEPLTRCLAKRGVMTSRLTKVVRHTASVGGAVKPPGNLGWTPLAVLSAIDDRFRAIFDSVQDGIFITDPATGRFIEVNAAGCAMFGHTKAAIIGKNIALLSSGIYPYTLDAAIETSKKALPGEAKMLEWQCKKKDGTLFWVESYKHYTKIPDASRLNWPWSPQWPRPRLPTIQNRPF